MENTQKQGSGIWMGVLLGCGGCLGVFVIGIAAIVIMAIPTAKIGIDAARNAAKRMMCMNHEKQIAIALHNYHDVFKSFPPAYTVDSEGNPLHSWRVLILPFIEQRALYESIRLDEPWDSAHNSTFHKQMPIGYICSDDTLKSARADGLTSFKWIVGPNTISEGSNCTKMSDVTRGTSNTIAFVEVHPTTNWMQPADLSLADLEKGINASPTEGIGSLHKDIDPHAARGPAFPAGTLPTYGGTNIAYMDGTVHFISEKTPAKELLEKALISDRTE